MNELTPDDIKVLQESWATVVKSIPIPVNKWDTELMGSVPTLDYFINHQLGRTPPETGVTSDIEFTINVYDYENDRDAVKDWRDDERFDLLTDLAMTLFSVDVDTNGSQVKV